jgi:hypothetical protein
MSPSRSNKPVSRNTALSNIQDSFTLAGYTNWIQEVSRRYRQSQIKAAIVVNTEMLKFYFSLGRDITLMESSQPWGSGFMKKLSIDLKTTMPEAECLSQRNLYYMRVFFKLYASMPILHQVGAKLETDADFLSSSSISHQIGGLFSH